MSSGPKKAQKPESDRDRKPDADREATPEQQRPTPGPKKIREAPDNLRKREKWFRKRTR